MSDDANERIKVVNNDGSHKVLNTAFYDSPNDKYRYLRYIGAVVDSNKRVYIAAYGFNRKADEDTDPSVIISDINAGEKKFTHSLIKASSDFYDTKSVMLYNHNANKLELMTVTYNKSGMAGNFIWGSANFDYYKKKDLPVLPCLISWILKP